MKALLAARVVEGHMKDEVKVAVGDAPHAAGPLQDEPGRRDPSVKDAARAACSESDNRAANLLMKTLGGPRRDDGVAPVEGDLRTRIDRYEPDCNKTSAYDVRDKTRPSAITQLWRKLYLDFTPDERMEWEDMLKANKHSAHLFKGAGAARLDGCGPYWVGVVRRRDEPLGPRHALRSGGRRLVCGGSREDAGGDGPPNPRRGSGKGLRDRHADDRAWEVNRKLRGNETRGAHGGRPFAFLRS